MLFTKKARLSLPVDRRRKKRNQEAVGMVHCSGAVDCPARPIIPRLKSVF